jgi:hypothetical protein
MRSELSVTFTLRGVDLDPDEVTRQLGLQPTESWRAGEPSRLVRPARFYSDNAWRLHSGLPATTDLEEQVKSLLTRLEPVWKAAVALGKGHYAEFSCVVYSYGGDRPAISFDNDVVRQIAELNAALDVDLYVL